jgi:hypothetical protein
MAVERSHRYRTMTMANQLVRAALRRLHSPDALDLRSFHPSDPLNFGILVQAMIGPADAEGEESFDFMLVTPQWITRELQTRDALWGRSILVISRYAYETLERAVLALCNRAEGEDWSQVANILNRSMTWEFEDYREPHES